MSDAENRTPEQLSTEITEKEQIKREAQRRIEEARIAINTAGENKNVEILLRYIMRTSGYTLIPVVRGMNGDILVNSSMFNAGREAMYHELRSLMSAETKNIVERSI